MFGYNNHCKYKLLGGSKIVINAAHFVTVNWNYCDTERHIILSTGKPGLDINKSSDRHLIVFKT